MAHDVRPRARARRAARVAAAAADSPTRSCSDCSPAVSLERSDRAFATELFYGVLRNLTLLDFWIGLLRSGSVDDARAICCGSASTSCFVLRTPGHAAVFETVAARVARAAVRSSTASCDLRNVASDELRCCRGRRAARRSRSRIPSS